MDIYSNGFFLCASSRCDVARGKAMGFRTYLDHLVIPKDKCPLDSRGRPICPVCKQNVRTKEYRKNQKRKREARKLERLNLKKHDKGGSRRDVWR